MVKTASTRQIIEYLQAYEKTHGIGSINSIGSVGSGSRDIEYIFNFEDKNGNETKVEIPTIDKGDIWNETSVKSEKAVINNNKEYLLDPCPFCNYQRKDDKKIGQLIIREKEYDINREKGDNAVKSWYHVICLKCKCQTKDYDTEEKVINAWNMRGENND